MARAWWDLNCKNNDPLLKEKLAKNDIPDENKINLSTLSRTKRKSNSRKGRKKAKSKHRKSELCSTENLRANSYSIIVVALLD